MTCRHLACDRPAGHFGDGQLCMGHARRLGIGPDHGTHSRYSRGCRCEPCRAAGSRYRADYYRIRKRLRGDRGGYVDPAPAAARLRVLRDEGWTYRELHGALGCSPNLIADLIHERNRRQIRAVTARKIAALYQRDAQERRAA